MIEEADITETDWTMINKKRKVEDSQRVALNQH